MTKQTCIVREGKKKRRKTKGRNKKKREGKSQRRKGW